MSHRMLRNAQTPQVDLRSYNHLTVRCARLPASGNGSLQSVHPSHKSVSPASSPEVPVGRPSPSLTASVVKAAAAASLVVILFFNPQPLLAAGIEPIQEISQIAPSGWAAGFQEAFARLFPAGGAAPAPGLGAEKRAEQYSGPASTTNATEVPPLSKLLQEVAEPFPGRKSVISKEAKRAKKSEDQDRARELARDSDDNVNRASKAALDSSVLLNAVHTD